MLDSISCLVCLVYHCFLGNKIIKQTFYVKSLYLPYKDTTIAFAAYHIMKDRNI